jgi:hypothetical protein
MAKKMFPDKTSRFSQKSAPGNFPELNFPKEPNHPLCHAAIDAEENVPSHSAASTAGDLSVPTATSPRSMGVVASSHGRRSLRPA